MPSVLPKIIFLAVAAALFLTSTFEVEAFLSPIVQKHDGRRNSGIITSIVTSSAVSSKFLSVLSAMDFKQLPGESDIAFIKRITSSSNDGIQQRNDASSSGKSTSKAFSSTPINATGTTDSPRGTYKRIEEWDEERKAKGELTWEEKVQFEGQRFGNRVKQDNILRHHIGTFF
ncbi:hypothetical protein IV203_031845 [Nitzschia inconspicua]|uniref:Uncharacterized protein n=1 Tax=Nitzschia inconspicua TaxID=303405 RepID=A0A9K3Q2R2_9STRA|nr:hypothetical protein IV203_031845 [Nitzschia inconspicua]